MQHILAFNIKYYIKINSMYRNNNLAYFKNLNLLYYRNNLKINVTFQVFKEMV